MNELLADRIILRKEISSAFKESIEIRYMVALKLMNLSHGNIQLCFCSTINKHTCLKTKKDSVQKLHVVIDQHQVEVLGALNFLYYIYGQHNITKAFFDIVVNTSDYFRLRLNSIICLIKAERYLLVGKAVAAKTYMESSLGYKSAFCDIIHKEINDDDSSTSDLIFLKGVRADRGNIYILNFFVFHEMAHIKYFTDPDTFYRIKILTNNLIASLKDRYNSEKGLEQKILNNILLEECACDIYALKTLFQFIKENQGNFDIFNVIEAYIISLVHSELMGSIRDNSNNFYVCYIETSFRIIIVLDTLELLEADETEFQDIQQCMKDIFNKVNNAFRDFTRSWEDTEIHDIKENLVPWSIKWKSEMEQVIDVISKYN